MDLYEKEIFIVTHLLWQVGPRAFMSHLKDRPDLVAVYENTG